MCCTLSLALAILDKEGQEHWLIFPTAKIQRENCCCHSTSTEQCALVWTLPGALLRLGLSLLPAQCYGRSACGPWHFL